MNENENVMLPEEMPLETTKTEVLLSEEKTEKTQEERLRDETLRAHPMFSHFAKGKSGTDEALLRDFSEMLSLGEAEKAKNEAFLASKMTPSASHTIPDISLTERQKEIARAAGMTYKEYYELIGAVKDRR